MTDRPELKPCPFCGAALEIDEELDDEGAAFVEVSCPNDIPIGDTKTHPTFFAWGHDREQVIAVANMRHAPPPVEAIWGCVCEASRYMDVSEVEEWLDSVGKSEGGEA